MAAFWAGGAHPRRQKQREMPPPGASEPAFAATVEPASTQITSDLPTARLIYKRVLGDGLLLASILDFRPRFGNRCSVIAAAVRNGPPATSVAAKRFSVRFYSSLPQKRTARLLRPSPHRPSASDSNFVAAKKNGSACSGRGSSHSISPADAELLPALSSGSWPMT